jgi:hypothetical protein
MPCAYAEVLLAPETQHYLGSKLPNGQGTPVRWKSPRIGRAFLQFWLRLWGAWKEGGREGGEGCWGCCKRASD